MPYSGTVFSSSGFTIKDVSGNGMVFSGNLYTEISASNVIAIDELKNEYNSNGYYIDPNSAFILSMTAFDANYQSNDLIIGTDSNDFVTAAGGNDRIYLGSGNTNTGFSEFVGLLGTNIHASNVGFGGSGDDLIVGGDAIDVLVGDSGTDVLIGNGGSDYFVANVMEDHYNINNVLYASGREYIGDFEPGSDKIFIWSDYIHSWEDLLANASIYQDETSAVIEFNNSDAIVVLTFQVAADIDASYFAFV